MTMQSWQNNLLAKELDALQGESNRSLMEMISVLQHRVREEMVQKLLKILKFQQDMLNS